MPSRRTIRQRRYNVPLTAYKSSPCNIPYLRFPVTALPRLKAWLQMYGFFEVEKGASRSIYLRMRHPFAPSDFIVQYQPWRDKRFCVACGINSCRIIEYYLANRPIVPPSKRTEDGRLVVKQLGEFPV